MTDKEAMANHIEDNLAMVAQPTPAEYAMGYAEGFNDGCKPKYDKDAEIKRLNEKIEFLARTNMLYSDWEHRETQVTSSLIRKGIEEHILNVELLSALSACLDWMEQLRTSGDGGNWEWQDDVYTKGRAIEAKLREKNNA